MTVLNEAEIRERLRKMPGWEYDGSVLHRVFTFDDYLSGIRFVDRLAEKAEEHDHHPHLEVGYGRVVVRWSSHSAGGVTERDLDLAALTDRI